MSATISRLKELLVDEISLVKRGANQGAKVVLYKMDTAAPEPRREDRTMPVDQMTAGQKFLGALKKGVLGALGQSDPAEQEEAISKAFEEAEEHLEKDAAPMKVCKSCGKKMGKDMKVCKSCGAMNKAEENDDATEKDADGVDKDEENDDATEKDADGVDKDDEGDVDKEDDPDSDDGTPAFGKSLRKSAVRHAIEKAEERAANAEFLANEAREEVAKMRQENTRRESVAKAGVLIGKVPADIGTIATVLEKSSPDEAAALEAVFKVANQAIEEASLLKTVGRRSISGSVNDSVEARASQIQKSMPKLSRAAAIAKVYEDNPKLYEESLRAAADGK